MRPDIALKVEHPPSAMLNHLGICAERLRSPQETVSHIARVNIVSGNRAGRIVGKRDSALEGTCPSSRNIERGDRAIQGTHETAIDVARVHVLSRDRPWPVESLG